MTKRMFDLAFSIVTIFACVPVFVAAILTIKVFSRGPILFTQERVGLQGKPFKIFKFRTMHTNSSALHSGTTTVENDPRFFPGAKLLRKLKIDELPQLFNVIIGNMSIVGPRPTMESDFHRMNEKQKGRFDVLPGLTGLAQIRGNTSLSWPRRIEHDLDYIQSKSIWLDIKIIFLTVWQIFSGAADTHPAGDDEWAE